MGDFRTAYDNLWKWFELPSDVRSLGGIDFSATIELNKFVVTSVLLFLVGVIIAVLIKSKVKKYDLFFSAPMSFSTDEEYKKIREDCLKLIDKIKNNTPYKNIYYGAESIESMKDFSRENMQLRMIWKPLEIVENSFSNCLQRCQLV